MTDFVAIDFETANGEPCSVCSVGIVMVRGGRVADTFYSLVHPTPDYYAPSCQRVHGLGPGDTDAAPLFPDVWAEAVRRIAQVYQAGMLPLDDLPSPLEPGRGRIPFVAHNARFDEGCLRAAFRTYQMDYPDYTFFDTLRASRRTFGRSLPNHRLPTVAAACGYDLRNHHHALADAEACAAIAMRIL